MKVTIKIVAYYRVSTKKQGQSGLGLDAQKKAVADYCAQVGGKVIAEYTEVETGRNSERPQLTQAIAHARLSKATLVVAKLDRLARNVRFTATLLESGVEFIAADNPNANNFTIHILAACAEKEAVDASRRTKDALAEAKKQGKQLGSSRPGHWDGRENKRGWKQGAKKSGEARSKRCRDAYSFLVPKLRELQETQNMSYEDLARWLNENGHTTIGQGAFSAATVWRILKRAEEEVVVVKPEKAKRRKVSA